MSSRSRLYTRSRTQHTTNAIEKINLVVFDIDINTMRRDSMIEIQMFKEDEVDVWFDYITSDMKNIYLFVSNLISDTFVQFIHDYPQITSIYIFCKDKQYKNYSNTSIKIRGIYDDAEEMFKQFQKDIYALQERFYSEESTFKNIDPESGEVLWWLVFEKILLHIKHTNTARDEFTKFCRDKYLDNECQPDWIAEFERNYESYEAIRWYSRNCVYYHILNSTLRKARNLNDIFKVRLVITDLISQLSIVQLDHLEWNADPFIVYRGCMMTVQQIQKMTSMVGKRMLTNQFLSCTFNHLVAEMFTAGKSIDFFRQSVIFTIEVDSCDINESTIPFADISNITMFPGEGEVLFSIFSTFLVESIQQEDGYWNIRLKHMNNSWDIDFGERSIFSPHADQIFIRNLSKENKQFIAFQLLVDLILRLDQNNYAREELLEFCKSKYQDDMKALQEIADFERNYRSEDAAKWFTKGCFLYRLLNQTLRIETVDFIVKMRYYIHDLHNQLAELQPSFIQSLNEEKNIILYQGQLMKLTELNDIKENYDGFISMNSFLSASTDIEVTNFFSGDGMITIEDEVSVIYEMLVDTDIRSTPYAKIPSFIPDEEEILFSIGAVFRIGDVDEIRNRVYRVKLTMVYREDELWNKLTAHLD